MPSISRKGAEVSHIAERMIADVDEVGAAIHSLGLFRLL
jgi:hypothetical protein